MDDVTDPASAECLAAIAPDEHLRRREFLARVAKTAGASLALAGTLGVEPLMAEAARRQARAAATPSPSNWPIDTFVVVMMENRSFDHFLGWLPKADGRQAGLSYRDSSGASFSTYSLGSDYQGCGRGQPGHIWQQGRVQFNGGKVDGFLLDGSGNDTFAIGYYHSKHVPMLAHLARTYATCDRYFASLMASTNPNRSYAHAAQSYGGKYLFDKLPGDGAPQVPTPPGFDPNTMIEARLQSRGRRGMTFYSDVNYAGMWGTGGARRSREINQFFQRAALGTLPALSFVDPQQLTFKELSGVSNDQHPQSDIRTGEAFYSDVIRAFMASPQWRRGALFLVWDEWGGFFDHVRPPSVPDAQRSSNLDENFGQMGFRVPAVVISPYVRRGEVIHTRFGHESILRMVERRFALKPLTVRDARANSIETAFDFSRRPPREEPDLPYLPHIISQPCPAR